MVLALGRPEVREVFPRLWAERSVLTMSLDELTPGASEQLYVARLQELMNNPTQSTRLGLYRIGHEGKFDLDYSYGEQILELTARRRVL